MMETQLLVVHHQVTHTELISEEVYLTKLRVDITTPVNRQRARIRQRRIK